MKKYLIITLSSLIFSLNIGYAQASIIKNIGEEIFEVFAKKGTKELVAIGGKEGIQEGIEIIAKEGGKEVAERTLMYSKIYGTSAFKAIKVSPKKVTQALDSTPSQYKRNMISIVNKNPTEIAKRLDNEGIDFLKLESKFPAIGDNISKLGPQTSKIAFDLPKGEAAILARNAPCLEKVQNVSPSAYSNFLTSLKNAPKKTIELLNNNPKVLFTGAALTAFMSAKEELLREGGVVEETITKPLTLFTYSLVVLVLIFIIIKVVSINKFFKFKVTSKNWF